MMPGKSLPKPWMTWSPPSRWTRSGSRGTPALRIGPWNGSGRTGTGVYCCGEQTWTKRKPGWWGARERIPQPTALQTEFILKSREDATRRQRTTLIGVGTALVVAVGLGILAWTQRNVAVAKVRRSDGGSGDSHHGGPGLG